MSKTSGEKRGLWLKLLSIAIVVVRAVIDLLYPSNPGDETDEDKMLAAAVKYERPHR